MASKIRYMNTRDRPIYSYTFGHAFIYLLCSGVAVPVGFLSWLASCALFPGHLFLLPFLIILVMPSSFLLGFMMAKSFFFVTRRVFFLAGFDTVISGALIATGFLSWFSCDFTPRDPSLLSLGLIMFGCVATLVSWWVKRLNHIRLFTDGVFIGNLVMPYKDVVTVAYATGKDVGSRVPQEGKGLELKILTPLDFEYIERDFGIFHHYVIIVTRTCCYVAQSLSSRSDFPANVRNAWACYVYDMQHGINHPLH